MLRRYIDIIIGLISLLKESIWNFGHLRVNGIRYYIGRNVKIQCTNDGIIDLGEKTWIEKDCYFKATGGTIKCGYNNYFNMGVKITSRESITIGDNNLFGPNVVIVDHDHKYDIPDQLICKQGFTSGKVHIGSNIWIGANVLICQGVSICDRVVVGGNAVITKPITESGVYTGIPARKIKDI